MGLAQSMLPEFDAEMASTRRLIEACPEARANWKPHAKSSSLGDLALHLASLIDWTNATLASTELDLAPPGGPAWTPPKFVSMQATLAMFDVKVAAARKALAAASDAELGVLWSLKVGGNTLFTMPRSACLRSFVMNHLIHHRGQLSVYLRLIDVPVPQVYGPTADFGM